MPDTALAYLLWGPLGTEPLERFATSYAEHPSGHEHHLVVLLKGVPSGEPDRRSRAIAADLGGECITVGDSGLDVDTYRWAAEHLDAAALCFLNTSSEILATGWLRALHSALADPGVGLVGATASNETLLSSVPRPLRVLVRRRYPPFPNPHVRSNAFMLERETMLSLTWAATRRKHDALALENGRWSITRQVQQRGLQTLVVGRDGHRYEPDEWQRSHTFRSGSQENLLVADNRTREYETADPDRRAALARFSWGKPGAPDDPPAAA